MKTVIVAVTVAIAVTPIGGVAASGPDMGLVSGQCSSPVFGENLLSDAHGACMKNAAGSLGDQVNCNNAESHRLDVLLNARYQAALKRLNARRSVLLKESQRAWLALRRPHCTLEVPETGATQDRSDEQLCALKVLANRVCYLQQLDE